MQKIQERSLALDLFLCGSILIIGLYHLFLFFLRKKDRSPLYFSIFCVLVAVRLLATGERYLTHLVPEISWELVIKIEYLAFYLAVPVFAAFCYTLFYRDVSKGIIQVIQLTGIFFSGIVLVTTAGFYSHTLQSYQIVAVCACFYGIYVLIVSMVRKREGAFLFPLEKY